MARAPGAHRLKGQPGPLFVLRGVLAGALSMLVPGLGQLLARRYRRGAIMLGITAGILAASAVVAAGGAGQFVRLAVDPNALVAILVANAALGAFRVVAAIDALAIMTRGRLDGVGQRVAAGATGVALVVLTAAPHGVAANHTWQTREVLTTVFVTDPPTDHSGDARPAPVDDSEADDRPLDQPESNSPTPDAADMPGPEVEVEVTTSAPWDGRLTIALLGIDAGPGRSGARADTLVVVSVDPPNGQMVSVSVPRNLQDFPLPDHLERLTSRCPDGQGYHQISGLYACLTDPRFARDAAGSYYPDAPDPAARGVADALEELLGQPIDYYAVVDLGGFVDLVDAVGGVDIYVANPISVELSSPHKDDEWQTFDLPRGEQQLDGLAALAFVRSRTGSDDYDRMRRQRCLIGAMVDQADPLTLLRTLPKVASVIAERVRTDIPLDALPALIDLAGEVDIDESASLGLTPPRYQAADRSPRLSEIRAAVAAMFIEAEGAADGISGTQPALTSCH